MLWGIHSSPVRHTNSRMYRRASPRYSSQLLVLVGITLTAAKTIIFRDRPWTPGDIMQAEDRIRRIGQTKNTRSIWMTAFELDSQVDAMLADKNQSSPSQRIYREIWLRGQNQHSKAIGIDYFQK